MPASPAIAYIKGNEKTRREEREGRREAVADLADKAKQMGADAVISLRMDKPTAIGDREVSTANDASRAYDEYLYSYLRRRSSSVCLVQLSSSIARARSLRRAELRIGATATISSISSIIIARRLSRPFPLLR